MEVEVEGGVVVGNVVGWGNGVGVGVGLGVLQENCKVFENGANDPAPVQFGHWEYEYVAKYGWALVTLLKTYTW